MRAAHLSNPKAAVEKSKNCSEHPDQLQCQNMIIFYLLFLLLFNCFAFAQQESGHDEDSVFVDQTFGEEQCFNNTDLDRMMSDILDKMTIMEECLLQRKEKIADIECISACTAAVRESIKEVQDLVNPEQEYHLGVNNPGKKQHCTVSRAQEMVFTFMDILV